MKQNNNNRDAMRPIIGIGGGHREYDMEGIDTTYVVEGRFTPFTMTEKDTTLADAMGKLIEDEFAELTPQPSSPKMKSKPARSTAGRER